MVAQPATTRIRESQCCLRIFRFKRGWNTKLLFSVIGSRNLQSFQSQQDLSGMFKADSMDHTSVEDFQNYHNRRTTHDALPTHASQQDRSTEAIEDYFDRDNVEDQAVSFSGSARHSSGPDEPVFDAGSWHSSPRTSDDDDISDLPSETHEQPSSPFTPLKSRPPFRNPSSVRAMQMETTPPPFLPSPSSQIHYQLKSPSRNGTPRSTRSYHSTTRSPSKLSPTKKPKKEYPLVLLHVTLLPITFPYSSEAIESVLPGYILENLNLLREKATDTVLDRGVLIPHPREDYDLLEERLLESLELKLPRILKCGHFHLSPDEEADILADEDSYDSDDNDADICDDCGRRLRDGRFGSGTGSRRWDIKIYAANGLMRAGAWGAAWREMERVDVEILPWIAEDMKRELELRREEEEQHVPEQEEEIAPESTGNRNQTDQARLREIYGEDPQACVDSQDDGLGDDPHPWPPSTQNHPSISHRPSPQHNVPLSQLLKAYLHNTARDRRNIAIFLLSLLVLYLAISSRTRAPLSAPRALQTIPFPAPSLAPDTAETTTGASIIGKPSSAQMASSSSVRMEEPSSSVQLPSSSSALVETPSSTKLLESVQSVVAMVVDDMLVEEAPEETL
ncbi:hypothetical protein MMC12_003536 [Toensbergia leucococca]|nr:hypothetical protein [Toensbergia leucococca]